MRRLHVLAAALIPVLVSAAADPAREAASVITELAAALTAGNASEFLRHFDPAIPEYDKLKANVTALTRQAETQSYVDVVSNQGDDQARTLVLTWELRVQRTGDATATVRPETRVTCKLRRQGKQWRIVSFTPLDFLGG
jgi:murein L,D-transpeptidase YcbB/YkuD